jgi:hypothetical protein
METPYKFTVENVGLPGLAEKWQVTVKSPKGTERFEFASEEEATAFVVEQQIGSPEQFLKRLADDLGEGL